jgi:hypothetical protein
MKSIHIPGTQIKCSKFVFGTASMLRVGSYAKRIELLQAALESGFTHFDTSPYYGFGIAEQDLSYFSSNPQVTIATKVGIYPPGGSDQRDAFVRFRKVAGKIFPSLSKPIVDFSVRHAAISLEDSLRRLKREFVDLLFLHEPLYELVNTDEWLNWLSKLVDSGKIRYYGLSTTKTRVLPFLQENSNFLQVCQLQDSFEDPIVDLLSRYGRSPQITFGYVSSSINKQSLHVDQILSRALMANPEGAIIVTSTKLSRIRQYSKALKAES